MIITNGEYSMRVICHDCQEENEFDPYVFRCTCGGAWEPIVKGGFALDSIQKDLSSVWRYQDIFRLRALESPIGGCGHVFPEIIVM